MNLTLEQFLWYTLPKGYSQNVDITYKDAKGESKTESVRIVQSNKEKPTLPAGGMTWVQIAERIAKTIDEQLEERHVVTTESFENALFDHSNCLAGIVSENDHVTLEKEKDILDIIRKSDVFCDKNTVKAYVERLLDNANVTIDV
tara:strand:+ start:3841 stop:4275 length:435 start_codon:yes stop_codon:yes gene_type:complete